MKRCLTYLLILAIFVTILPFAFAQKDNASGIEIVLHPQNYNYSPDAKKITYEAAAYSADGEELKCVWYIADKEGQNECVAEELKGYICDMETTRDGEITESTITIKKLVGSVGNELNYSEIYCVFSDMDGEEAFTLSAAINLDEDLESDREQPRLQVPAQLTVMAGDPLVIECKAFPHGQGLKYQWCTASAADTKVWNYDSIEGAQDKTFDVPTNNPGQVYYLCNVKYEDEGEEVPGNRTSVIQVTIIGEEMITGIKEKNIDLRNLDNTSILATAEWDFDEDGTTDQYEVELHGESLKSWLFQAIADNSSLLPEELYTLISMPAGEAIEVNSGEKVSIICQADGISEFEWYYCTEGSDEMLCFDDTMSSVNSDGKSVLEFTATEEMNGYTFFCKAVKKLWGKSFEIISTGIELIVSPAPIEEPEQIELPDEPMVTENEANKETDQDARSERADDSECEGVPTAAIVFLVLAIISAIAALAGAALIFMKLKR